MSRRSDVANRLMYICKQEGIAVEKDALTDLATATNGDIRQVGAGERRHA